MQSQEAMLFNWTALQKLSILILNDNADEFCSISYTFTKKALIKWD